LSSSSDYRLRKHPFQDDFHGHGVAALSPSLKEITITLPGAVLEKNGMGIIISIESYRESFEVDSVTLFCISFSFLDFADHPIIHVLLPPFKVR
jgi:hypothetical protein